MYKCIVSFRIFDLTWLYLCKPVIGLVWNIKWMIFSFKFILYKETEQHKIEFLSCILYLKMPDFRSFKGLCPLDTHQTSALDLLGGGLAPPRPPSWIRKEPAVIAYRAYGTIRSNKEHQEVRARENRTSTSVTT